MAYSGDEVNIEEQGPSGILDTDTALKAIPGEELIVPFQHCLKDLVYEDGTQAPDENFHYHVRVQFESEADRRALLEHPDTGEIYNTMKAFLAENADTAFNDEIFRDFSEEYIENGESSFRTLTTETVNDLEYYMQDLPAILNETYGVNISGLAVNHNSEQVQGCNNSWVLPENLAATPPSLEEPQYEVSSPSNNGFTM